MIVKKILLVDGDNTARSRLTAELRAYEEFRVLSTDCAKTAAKLIKTQQIDFLITELRLPEINGLKLLAYLKKYSPSTHAVAITDFFSDQLIEKVKNVGIQFYLNKPVNVDALIDFIFEKLAISPTSSIHGVTLASFLQLVNLEQKTCTLTLRSNENQVENRGAIHCVKGEIIGAQAGELTGRQAFIKTMGWKNPTIKILNECQSTQREIHQSFMHLLMESQQVIDESGDPNIQPPRSMTPGTDVEPLPDEFLRDSETYKELKTILSETFGVSSYDIFNGDRRLTTKSESDHKISALPSPMAFLSIGDTLKHLVGSSLKYSKISQIDRSSVLLGKYHQFLVRAQLKPGTEANDVHTNITR